MNVRLNYSSRRRPGKAPIYKFADGDRAYGPEFHQATRFGELARDDTEGVVVIGLVLWSDDADMPSGSRHIMRVSLSNILTVARFKDPSIK